MTDFSSFPEPFNAVVIGSSGGIGKAFVSALENHDNVERIFKLSRKEDADIHIDICDETSIEQAVAQIDSPINLIIVATGLLHDDDLMPEKGLRDISADKMKKLFEVNTIGPTLLAKHFIPLIPRTGKSVFAALSARVGSISDNRLGGWHSYRTSKAALNMMLKNIAIETARKHKEAAIIGLHPGTVDTNLSSPFQSNVKEGKLFTPEKSTGYLLDVIDQVKAEDTGKIFAWDGQEIEP